MIFEGPLVLAPSWSLRRLFIDVDDGNIHAGMATGPTRVRRWVNARIHVPERPDWVFVKVFAHGASSPEDEEEVLGPHFESALTELERNYNDGSRYVLHYVTAREVYPRDGGFGRRERRTRAIPGQRDPRRISPPLPLPSHPTKKVLPDATFRAAPPFYGAPTNRS